MSNLESIASGTIDSATMAAIGVFIFVVLLIALAVYIYMALALMKTAKRLKVKNAWLAWIPVANLYLMSKMAKKHWWPILLVIGTFLGPLGFLFGIALAVFVTIWTWKICKLRKRPGWWALLALIPIVNLVIWGILAWSKR